MAQELVSRRKERLYRYAIDQFVRLSAQVQGKEYIDYRANKLDRQGWDLFWDHYRDSHIGEEFILKFVEFGFQSWYNDDWIHKVHKSRSKSIRFNWIFGNKGIRRWEAMDQRRNVDVVRDDLKQKYNIVEERQRSPLFADMVRQVRDTEEKFKEHGYCTDEGLISCLQFTTLYNHLSPLCAACTNADECKELLKENFHKIYIERGYE